jgi:periplasmic divalent cation tolerance protein
MSVWVMISTTKSVKVANGMAKDLVGAKLAACVSVFPGIISHFSWEGKICREKEAMILVKTTKKNSGKILRKIKEIHKYDLPEVLFFQAVGGSKKYLDWIEKITAGK